MRPQAPDPEHSRYLMSHYVAFNIIIVCGLWPFAAMTCAYRALAGPRDHFGRRDECSETCSDALPNTNDASVRMPVRCPAGCSEPNEMRILRKRLTLADMECFAEISRLLKLLMFFRLWSHLQCHINSRLATVFCDDDAMTKRSKQQEIIATLHTNSKKTRTASFGSSRIQKLKSRDKLRSLLSKVIDETFIVIFHPLFTISRLFGFENY